MIDWEDRHGEEIEWQGQAGLLMLHVLYVPRHMNIAATVLDAFVECAPPQTVADVVALKRILAEQTTERVPVTRQDGPVDIVIHNWQKLDG